MNRTTVINTATLRGAAVGGSGATGWTHRNLALPVLALALVAAVLLLPAGKAEAHGLDRLHAVTYTHGHRRHGDRWDGHLRVVLPHWLRHDSGFRRWYLFNHYRYAHHVSWRSLHQHYLRDHRYHRSLRRGHKHAHRDHRRGHKHAYRDHRRENRHAYRDDRKRRRGR